MFALVDCNSFYASCEQVFRPDLRGRAVVVLSNNDGCVVARTAEAKQLGIPMGAAWHQVPRDIAARTEVFSSNYTLYADMSRRVQAVLSRYAQRIEHYSIDESFLAFSPGPDWASLGREIKATVRRHTGIPVSVGFGPTKVLAKAANKAAKKRQDGAGVTVLQRPDEIREVLSGMPTAEVWGIGSRLAERLKSVGVETAWQLAELDTQVARKLLSVVGQRIVLELRGTSCLAIEEVVPAKQHICTAKSFGSPLETLDELREPLATYVSRVAEKLRAQRSVCGRISVFLQTNPFQPQLPQLYPGGETVLATPSNFTPELVAAAQAVLTRIYRPGYLWKKVGVMLLDLGPEAEVQSAFDTPVPEIVSKRRKVMTALDELNRVFGRATVSVASAATREPPVWKMRQIRLSPRYTTCWQSLPVASG